MTTITYPITFDNVVDTTTPLGPTYRYEIVSGPPTTMTAGTFVLRFTCLTAPVYDYTYNTTQTTIYPRLIVGQGYNNVIASQTGFNTVTLTTTLTEVGQVRETTVTVPDTWTWAQTQVSRGTYIGDYNDPVPIATGASNAVVGVRMPAAVTLLSTSDGNATIGYKTFAFHVMVTGFFIEGSWASIVFRDAKGLAIEGAVFSGPSWRQVQDGEQTITLPRPAVTFSVTVFNYDRRDSYAAPAFRVASSGGGSTSTTIPVTAAGTVTSSGLTFGVQSPIGQILIYAANSTAPLSADGIAQVTDASYTILVGAQSTNIQNLAAVGDTVLSLDGSTITNAATAAVADTAATQSVYRQQLTAVGDQTIMLSLDASS